MKPELIINAVCEFYEIPVELIKSMSRKKEIVKARFVAMFFIRRYTRLFLQEIGSYFTKDHATVIYGVRRVDKMLFTDPVFAGEIRSLTREIKRLTDDNFTKYENYETDRC